jgi:N-acetyl-anhydromuramyl-L-alanine amidase AmpD
VNYFSRDGAAPYFTVLHYSGGAGGVDSLRRTLESRGVSAHYGVARNGETAQYLSEAVGAWHAGDHTKDWTGGSRFPTLEQLKSDFIPLSEVPYKKKYVNQYSDGIEICNVGYGKGGHTYVFARHDNPGCRRTLWEEYTPEQYDALAPIIRFPYVTDHSSLVNRHTLGRVGGKVDIGPAFDYSRLPKGLKRVRFDYKRIGWVVTDI